MKNTRGMGLIIAGLLLIAAALAIVGYNEWENMQAEASVSEVMEQLRMIVQAQVAETSDEEQEVVISIESPSTEMIIEQEIPDYILNPNMEMPTETIGKYDYIGILRIEACEIELPVISNWSYPALKVSPCRFEGSVYTDDMIISAHDYRAHFKRIRDLSGGEKVVFTDTAGNEFDYKVMSVETINGADVEGLTSGEWDLTLFTCTVDGASRVVVRCEK